MKRMRLGLFWHNLVFDLQTILPLGWVSFDSWFAVLLGTISELRKIDGLYAFFIRCTEVFIFHFIIPFIGYDFYAVCTCIVTE